MLTWARRRRERAAQRAHQNELAKALGFQSAEEALEALNSDWLATTHKGLERQALWIARRCVGAHDVRLEKAGPGLIGALVLVTWWRWLFVRSRDWAAFHGEFQRRAPLPCDVRVRHAVTLCARKRSDVEARHG